MSLGRFMMGVRKRRGGTDLCYDALQPERGAGKADTGESESRVPYRLSSGAAGADAVISKPFYLSARRHHRCRLGARLRHSPRQRPLPTRMDAQCSGHDQQCLNQGSPRDPHPALRTDMIAQSAEGGAEQEGEE